MNVFRQQGMPAQARRRMLDHVGEDVRNACAEVRGKVLEEVAEVLLGRGGDSVARASPLERHVDGEAVAFGTWND